MKRKIGDEKKVTFSYLEEGRTFDVDPFVGDVKETNACEAMRFLDCALDKIITLREQPCGLNLGFFHLKMSRETGALVDMLTKGDGEFRAEVHSLATMLLEKKDSVPSCLRRKPYEFCRVAEWLQKIKSATAATVDEKTRTKSDAMVKTADEKAATFLSRYAADSAERDRDSAAAREKAFDLINEELCNLQEELRVIQGELCQLELVII